MDIIKGIISEAEVLDMPDETLAAFVGLFGQEMFKMLADYMDREDCPAEVLNKLNRSVGSLVSKSTFHTRVNSREIKAIIFDNRLRDLPEHVFNRTIDVDDFIGELRWLQENESNLVSTLPARTKEMFDLALGRMKEFQADRSKHHDHDIPKLMNAYKRSLFCPPHAKAVSTGMRGLTLNKDRWRMQLRAAEYLKYCLENGISQTVAREC